MPIDSMSGPELKAEAIRLLPLTCMSKRECWKKYEGKTRGWTTIQRYFDPGYPKSYPSPKFVQWLTTRAQITSLLSLVSEFETAAK